MTTTGQPKWVSACKAHPTVAHYSPECPHFMEGGVLKWPPRPGTPEELARCRPCSTCDLRKGEAARPVTMHSGVGMRSKTL